MKIEILYPEICNLYGDIFNITYLSKCVENCELIETSLNETPKFVNEKVDLIYLGPMTEKNQELAIQKLKPYKESINQNIENKTFFLFTGNAFEILGNYIENEDGSKIEALGIIDLFSKRNMMKRYSALYLGEYKNTKIVGFKSQFSHTYGDNKDKSFVTTIRGVGLNKENDLEGIRINNFIGTYILGPILILNPEFTKILLQEMNIKEFKLPFETTAQKSYEARLKEYEDPARHI